MYKVRGQNNFVLGAMLIVVGLFFQGVNSGWLRLDQERLWPVYIIAPGLILIALSLSTTAKNTILPGTIVTGIGVFFLVRQWGLLPWSMDLLWPIFPGIVGVGFLLTYQIGSRDRGLLIPAFILLAIAAIFLASNFNLVSTSLWRLWPILLVVVGFILMISSK